MLSQVMPSNSHSADDAMVGNMFLVFVVLTV